MASATKLLFSKDENRKTFGLGMLPKLKDLKGKLHGLNFPRVRKDCKSSIPVISVIPPTPKTQKSAETPTGDRKPTAVGKSPTVVENQLESNNNDKDYEGKDSLSVRRVSNQRRYSEPIVLSDSELDRATAAKDFLKVPRRRVKKRRRKHVMKKSLSADDIVTLQWLATNSVIDHGVAEFCSDGAILDVSDGGEVDNLVKFMVGDCSQQQTKSSLEKQADPGAVSKSEADLFSNDKKVKSGSSPGQQRSISYHSLLYDFDVASSYQIYQPTVYEVEEDGLFGRHTTTPRIPNTNRNSVRFKKAFDQGQVYLDSIVDMIKAKAEQHEAKKYASLPTNSPPTAIYSNKYILSK